MREAAGLVNFEQGPQLARGPDFGHPCHRTTALTGLQVFMPNAPTIFNTCDKFLFGEWLS